MRFLGMMACVLAMAAMAAELDPVFHLTFDEEKAGATTCVDRMNPERVCNLLNLKRVSFGPGKFGNALVLDNAKEKTAPADNPNAGIMVNRFWDPDFAKAMSIEVWVKIGEDVDYKRCLMYVTQVGWQYGPGFSLYYNWQNFMFLSGSTGKTDGMVRAVAPVADLRNQWVHVAATYDGEKKIACLYVNGECIQEKSDFVITPPRNLKAPLYIGFQDGKSRGWRGAIDELKIYKRALTPTEILEHAKAEL